MSIDRRGVLGGGSLGLAGMIASPAGAVDDWSRPKVPNRAWRRIATEEAFWTPAVAEAQRALGMGKSMALDIRTTRMTTDPENPVYRRLIDFDERLRVMDRDEVAMHVLSLTTPGVQMFEPREGTRLAALSNDHLAGIVARHPDRFAGLGCLAPQAPLQAVREMERAIKQLGFKGFIINGHTNGEFLDEQKYWPILEAAEALESPIYLHPRSPPDDMAGPFRSYDLYGVRWGFQAETSTHVMRMHMGKVFDRYPKLTVLIGHMGESLPGQIWRLDHLFEAAKSRAASNTFPDLKLSEVLKRNFYITTSGVMHEPILKYTLELFGEDRVMWAIDYPYEDSGEATKFMNNAGLSDATKEKLYHRNAERVFRLPAS